MAGDRLMFDTHAHLNFSRFKKNVNDVIQNAFDAGVKNIIIPGTDLQSSQKAIEISQKHDGLYASVGIHPHHVFEYLTRHSEITKRPKNLRGSFATAQDDIIFLEQLLSHPKVVAVGEIGMDRHEYGDTKYDQYAISDEFISYQRSLFTSQIKLAIKHSKSLIIHNREATDDVLEALTTNWDNKLSRRAVFHCCEANNKLLDFAKFHNMFIGVDGDITYDKSKQGFIKQVPLNMLVLETDSPFLLPEPLKSQKKYPNEPKNIKLVYTIVSQLLKISFSDLVKQTGINSKILFGLSINSHSSYPLQKRYLHQTNL